ncbi:putative reverse transcriptase domain-containing protein [Tanacetum coccineum]
MLAIRQGMSSEEMERVVSQRVVNAIEAIAIYETKIHMAHDSMNQVVCEEATVGKNVSNKMKWENEHKLSSFDIIIGMDWLANHHAVIVCDEKIIRIPYGDEVLIVQGLPNFSGTITEKKTKDKSEEKRLEDVPTIRDFSKASLDTPWTDLELPIKFVMKVVESAVCFEKNVAFQGGRVVWDSVCKKGDKGGVCLVTKYCSKQGGKEVGKVLGGDVVVRSWWCLDASLV